MGWVVFLLMSIAGIGLIGLLARWLWVGGVVLYVEKAHGGANAGETWRCPDCRLFNDAGTLTCLCGYDNPQFAGIENAE